MVPEQNAANAEQVRQVITWRGQLVILACGLFFIVLILRLSCGSAKHDLVSDVPLGSELSELNQYIRRAEGSFGEVVEWRVANKALDATEKPIKNEWGIFVPKALGSYDDWKASAEEKNKFTGEITFFHMSLTSSDANVFTYRNGKLCKKNWGFLPG